MAAMSFDSLPIWAFFLGTILIVMASIEVGYHLGTVAHQSEEEKESPVSGVSGAILALTAFMLAFTFGIVADRYDARKGLVREDANALRTTYLRAAFLPEPDRTETRRLLKQYLDLRLAFAQGNRVDPEQLSATQVQTSRIQGRLWDIAVAHGGRDLNSDVAALYIESLNEVFTIHATRIAVGVQARIPMEIWLVLYGLVILGMMSIGYHTGIAGSKRSNAGFILALSFAMVIVVIASLDRPGAYVRVSQQPLADLRAFMAADR